VENLQRQFEDDFPTMPGLARCDFCMAMKPPERLRAWPCQDFTIVTVKSGDTAFMGCECHTAADLPGSGELGRQRYEGAWAACADCRQDIDRNRWKSVTARALRNAAPSPVSVDRDRELLDGMQAMFRTHRLKGPWQTL
jgi:hypothetical protein